MNEIPFWFELIVILKPMSAKALQRSLLLDGYYFVHLKILLNACFEFGKHIMIYIVVCFFKLGALFDIYIGDPPVSLDAKQEIAERVCQLLKSEFNTN
jgi:hypothetical protein